MSRPVRNGRLSRRAFLGATSTLVLGGCRYFAPAPMDADVCVIGSGFAGVYLAQRLVDRGCRVIVLEAGPRLDPTAPADGAASLFPTTSAGSYAFPIDATRTIGVGGTSRKWNGVITRLLPSDLRMQTVRGLDVDWPIDAAQLDAYYCEAERALGVTGGPFIAGAEPARCTYPNEATSDASPASLLERPDLRFFPLAFGLRDGGPIRVDGEPLQRLLSSPLATLLDQHPVTGLDVARDGTVVGVDVQRSDGTTRRLRAHHIVVAAGVVETTRLLLLARAAGTRPIGGRLLGSGFNAHPRYRVQVHPRPDLPTFDRVHRSYLGNPDAFTGRGAFITDVHLAGGPPQIDMTLELEPAASNRLVLDAAKRDAWGRPTVTLTADWTTRDIQTREAALRLQGDLARPLGQTPVPPALRWFHPAGTCAMGRTAETGVVDPNLRVFATTNLFVSGASVFPTSGATNPTLTIVALSLRLGDYIATQLQHHR